MWTTWRPRLWLFLSDLADSVDEIYNLNNFDFYSKLTWTGYSDAHNWNLKNGRNGDETE